MKTEKSPKIASVSQPSAFEFFAQFPDEKSARDYLINARWPDSVICAHCGHGEVWKIRDGKLFTCKECRRQFTVRIGTVMEESRLPLRKWLFAMYLFGIHEKGVASTKMAEQIGVTQKTAWFMNHRIREGFQNDKIVFDGTVEADETFIGGKRKNMSKRKRKGLSGRGTIGKTPVLGIRQRDGGAVAFPVSNTSGPTLTKAIRRHVSPGSRVFTDEHLGYRGLNRTHRHETVCHGSEEYVRGEIHTNGIEGFWSIVKRAHYGIYHHWSKKHLYRYTDELAGRRAISKLPAFDDGDGSGITMIRLLVSGMVGKRLTYQKLTYGI